MTNTEAHAPYLRPCLSCASFVGLHPLFCTLQIISSYEVSHFSAEEPQVLFALLCSSPLSCQPPAWDPNFSLAFDSGHPQFSVC